MTTVANVRQQTGAVLRGTVILTAVVLLAACAGDADPPDSLGTSPNQDQGAGASLAHVHGLGIDPADGMLYAASHHGLFRIPAGGQPERTADTERDTMGFTVVGPGEFLASGHPDPREQGQPPHLGLIESVDAGRTWRSRSLAGEVDFHALEVRHDLVYGYDSQSSQLMVSADRQTWERRATLAMADLAVHPADPDTVLATTQDGLARSTDGGRAFQLVEAAPVLQLVDWPVEAQLVGVGPNGAVHTSADGGTTWTTNGQVSGRPQAVLALPADTAGQLAALYVATDTGIYVSADHGRTFQLRQPLAG